MIVFVSVVVCHSRSGSIMSKKQDDIQEAEQRVQAGTFSYSFARRCLVQTNNDTKLFNLRSPQ